MGISMPERYVCLNCIHIWTARSEQPSERQCSNCRRRVAAPLTELEKTVLIAKEWIDAHKKYIIPIAPLYFPPAFSSAMELIRKINPEFPFGVEILRKIYIMASRYNPRAEGFEGCLARLKLEGKL